jgi:AcrR family transcriptional regulator
VLKKSVRGRRPGESGSRDAVLAAARRQFLADGYKAVTMRSIAAEAGVDVALVSYYFGSKSALFGAAMSWAVNPMDVVDEVLHGDRAELAERFVRRLLSIWDDPEAGSPVLAMVAAAGQDPALAALLRELFERELIARLAAALGGDDEARQRAGYVAVVMGGLVFTRHILRIGPVATASVDDIVGRIAPALRAVLDPPA